MPLPRTVITQKVVAEPTGPRRLRVVASGEQPQQLVAYVVLAPTHLPPEDLFSPHVVVHPLPTAEPPGGGPVPREDGIRVDVEGRTARVDGRPLDLTYLEFEVLAQLTAHPNTVQSRSHLLELIWDYRYPGDGRTVDVHIARLRRKLGPVHRATIHTVRRAGYKYVPLATNG